VILKHSLPPDILHAILLGYVTQLVNRFVRLEKANNDNMFVFSDKYKDEVERDLLAVGHALSKQSDIDLPKTHFPGGYLLQPKKGEDNTSGKKNSPNARSIYDSPMLHTPYWSVAKFGKLHWKGSFSSIW